MEILWVALGGRGKLLVERERSSECEGSSASSLVGGKGKVEEIFSAADADTATAAAAVCDMQKLRFSPPRSQSSSSSCSLFPPLLSGEDFLRI